MSSQLSHADDTERRFGFGANWREFLKGLDAGQIAEAEAGLQRLLGREQLDGLTFLDIGSGSGLSSLAARRLGARVHSFDFDPDSVACTKSLRERYFANDADWIVERGSVLDAAYMEKLGSFDIVYSWGVLHHTGAMDVAIANAASRVAPGGMFALALYRKTALCWAWTIEKRWYTSASAKAQEAARALFRGAMRLAFAATGRDFAAYVRDYRSNRGMDYINDIHDWMGGYPYESIRPATAEAMMERLGFLPVRSFTRGFSLGLFGSGCDEYLFQSRSDSKV